MPPEPGRPPAGGPAPAYPTLAEMLRDRGTRHPDGVAFSFGGRGFTYGDLWRGACGAAGALARIGVERGRPVVMVLPNGPKFFIAFYGAVRIGAVPIPLGEGSGAARVRDIVRRHDAAAVIVPDGWGEDAHPLRVPFLGSSDLEHARPIDAESRGPAPEDPAFIQITSGSTGEPKGVELTHTAVLTNVEQMIAGMEITADDVFLSWLPVSHDMGLVLKTMVPFRLAARLELLPTRLSGVAQWLGAIQRTRATFVAAPDFAWRMCLRAVREPGRWDLSSLRVALNAAEMVRPTTLAAFARTFALPRVMVPGYGLAEATVGVSMQPPGTTPPVDERGFVAIGRPFAGVRLAVLDGARELADGEVGELAVASPAVTTGYRDDPEATAALFWRPGWIRTGDLAYRRPDGAVFLVGRAKNLIIQGGRSLAPAEVEAAVEELGFVRRAAAIGVDRGRLEGEQAEVLVELRRAAPPDPSAAEEMVVSVVEAVAARLGMRPARVDLLRPKSLPLTDTGKVRHGELRRRLLSGELAADGAILYPET